MSGEHTAGLLRYQRYRRLRRLNVVVGLVLGAQALLMLLLSNGLSLPVSAAYLTTDPVLAQGPAAPHEVFALPVGRTVALFLLLATLDHLLVAAPRLHEWYERGIDRHVSYARWVEYSVSASVMLVLIAMLVGIRDLAVLVLLFTASTAMILFGLLAERGSGWPAFWFGSLVGAVPWVLIALYTAKPPTVPGFVYAVVVLQLLLFFSFAVNMALQRLQVWRWRDYLYGEVTYVVLSLTAKSLLAWLVFANVLRS
jgi:hypothetical protein